MLIIVFIFSFLITQLVANEQNNFNQLFNSTIEAFIAKSEQLPYNYLANSNRECMIKKLKLDLNGEKFISLQLGLYAITSAAYLCLTSHEVHRKLFDMKVAQISNLYNKSDIIDCFVLKLNQMKMSSANSSKFHVVNDESKEREEDCKILNEIESKIIKNINELIKNYKLAGIDQCMNISAEDIKETSFEIFIIALTHHQNGSSFKYEKRKSIMRAERQNLKIFKCSMEVIDKSF